VAETEDHGGVSYRGGERQPTGGSWTICKPLYKSARTEEKWVDRHTGVGSVLQQAPMARDAYGKRGTQQGWQGNSDLEIMPVCRDRWL
jgi:hypothetical protein